MIISNSRLNWDVKNVLTNISNTEHVAHLPLQAPGSRPPTPTCLREPDNGGKTLAHLHVITNALAKLTNLIKLTTSGSSLSHHPILRFT